MKNAFYYVVTTILCIDITLYLSGGVSTIHLIFGGIPLLHAILITYLAVSGLLYYKSVGSKYGIMFIIYLVIMVGVLAASTPSLKEYSKSVMVGLADSILRGENKQKIKASGNSDLEDVSKDMTEVSLDDYYPIERRADFILIDKTGNSYDFILTLHGINNVKVFIKKRKAK